MCSMVSVCLLRMSSKNLKHLPFGLAEQESRSEYLQQIFQRVLVKDGLNYLFHWLRLLIGILLSFVMNKFHNEFIVNIINLTTLNLMHKKLLKKIRTLCGLSPATLGENTKISQITHCNRQWPSNNDLDCYRIVIDHWSREI